MFRNFCDFCVFSGSELCLWQEPFPAQIALLWFQNKDLKVSIYTLV